MPNHTPERGIVRFVHVLAEFPCDGCGKPALHMTRAGLSKNGTVNQHVDRIIPGVEIECKSCEEKQRAAERTAYNKRRAIDRWQANAKKQTGGRK